MYNRAKLFHHNVKRTTDYKNNSREFPFLTLYFSFASSKCDTHLQHMNTHTMPSSHVGAVYPTTFPKRNDLCELPTYKSFVVNASFWLFVYTMSAYWARMFSEEVTTAIIIYQNIIITTSHRWKYMNGNEKKLCSWCGSICSFVYNFEKYMLRKRVWQFPRNLWLYLYEIFRVFENKIKLNYR